MVTQLQSLWHINGVMAHTRALWHMVTQWQSLWHIKAAYGTSVKLMAHLDLMLELMAQFVLTENSVPQA